MAITWTLQIGATEKLLADWPVSNVMLAPKNQAATTLSFDADGTAFDGAALGAYGDAVILRRYVDAVATIWFVGQIRLDPRAATGGAEGLSYVAQDAWWYLDNLVLQQSWNLYDDGGGVISSQLKSSLVLFANLAGALITNGAQITEALQYAVDAGAPLQIGTIDPVMEMPAEEVRDLTCAEVIKRCLRRQPDCVTWFDYTTDPPTLHVRKRTNLTPVTIAASAVGGVEGVKLHKRQDLKTPEVVIHYEREKLAEIASVDEWVHYLTTDAYPLGADGTEFGALVMTVNLASRSRTTVKQEIEVAAFPTAGEPPVINKEDLDWWKSKLPWLAAAEISSLSIVAGSGSRTASDDLMTELIGGQVADWMTIDTATDTWTCKVNYTWTDPVSGAKKIVAAKLIEYSCVACDDAAGGAKSKIVSNVAEEPVPTGLAQAIYTVLNADQWEGTLTITEAEASSSVHLYNKLNVSGGLAAWATMDAFIAQVTHIIDRGQTAVVVGPAPHIAIGDLVDQLRINRPRGGGGGGLSARNTGKEASADIPLPNVGVKQSGSPAEGSYKQILLTDGTEDAGTDGPLIDIDAPNKKLTVKLDSDTHVVIDAANKVVTVTDGTKTGLIDLGNAGGRVRVTDGSKDADIALNDLPSAGVAKFRAYAYCDEGTEKTVYLLGTVPA